MAEEAKPQPTRIQRGKSSGANDTHFAFIPFFLNHLYRCKLFHEPTAASRSLLHGTMVVLLDLDDDDAFDPFARPAGRSGLQTPFQINQDPVTNDPEDVDCCNDNGMGKREKDRPNPNINGFSAALGCYP